VKTPPQASMTAIVMLRQMRAPVARIFHALLSIEELAHAPGPQMLRFASPDKAFRITRVAEPRRDMQAPIQSHCFEAVTEWQLGGHRWQGLRGCQSSEDLAHIASS
jgi:type II secretory pathway component PulM